MYGLLIALVTVASEDLCDSCNSALLGNGKCDLSCNLLPCNLDSLYVVKDPYQKTYFKYSDCFFDCLLTCDYSNLANQVCDDECNTKECAFDIGDCGYCAKGCTKSMLSNNICDEACQVPECNNDERDCVSFNAGMRNRLLIPNANRQQLRRSLQY